MGSRFSPLLQNVDLCMVDPWDVPKYQNTKIPPAPLIWPTVPQAQVVHSLSTIVFISNCSYYLNQGSKQVFVNNPKIPNKRLI